MGPKPQTTIALPRKTVNAFSISTMSLVVEQSFFGSGGSIFSAVTGSSLRLFLEQKLISDVRTAFCMFGVRLEPERNVSRRVSAWNSLEVLTEPKPSIFSSINSSGFFLALSQYNLKVGK